MTASQKRKKAGKERDTHSMVENTMGVRRKTGPEGRHQH